MLSNFSLSHLRFTLESLETIRLSRMNKGIALRGAFGTAFRRIVCHDLKADCTACILHSSCPYGHFFMPQVPPDSDRLRLVAFKELGQEGIGTGRGRFRIQEVEALDASGGMEQVWAGESNLVHAPQKRVTLGEIDKNLSSPSHSLRLHFLTPVLLKDKGQWVRPFFGPLMRRLRDRIHALSYFYCGEMLEMDFDGFGESADKIESKPGKMKWVE